MASPTPGRSRLGGHQVTNSFSIPPPKYSKSPPDISRLDIDDEDDDVGPDDLVGVASSTHTSHANSVSSLSHHSRSSSTSTATERSIFRNMVDSKNAAFRRKLSTRLSSGGMEDGDDVSSLSQGSRQPQNIDGMVLKGSKNPMQDSLPMRPILQPRHEIRGLERAVSVSQWRGGGLPPLAWGKLKRDPELWDPEGDTLIYFSKDRPEPSFRIHALVLEETNSQFFNAMLRQGYERNGNTSSSDAKLSQGQHPKAPRSISSLRKKNSQAFSQSSTAEAAVLHKIYLPAPPEASRTDVLRHHLTTRNVFAMLLNKSIVGLNFFQALIDLHERMQAYMPPDSDCTTMVINYVVSNRLDDVRNDCAAAAGLLAYCEEPTVRWREGWREAYVHCVGMFERLNPLPEFRDVSLVSRALLEHSHLELQIRIQDAEDRLATFNFEDIWPTQSALPPPARSSFDRLRKFLKQFYEGTYRTWPPKTVREAEHGWLNREVAIRLQRDFGALYDYFVDRDVVWDESVDAQKARITSSSGRKTFQADSGGFPITDMLAGFDHRSHLEHIPYPYPLLPTSMPVQHGSKSSFFGAKRFHGVGKRAAFAYSEASNLFLLGQEFVANQFVESFLKFEKTDQIGEIDPFDARKGRWIMIYCVLQVLSAVAVDTPDIRFKEDVGYFLNPRLKGTPPWKSPSDAPFEEATQATSHCWRAPRSWTGNHAIGWSGLRNHRQIVITSDGIGDGTGRTSNSSSDGRTAAQVSEEPRSRKTSSEEAFASRPPPNKLKPRSKLQDEVTDWTKVSSSNQCQDVGQSRYRAPEDW